MLSRLIPLSMVLIGSTLYPYERYIITGGPCVGKSTIIGLLKARGHQTTPEMFQELYTSFGAAGIESMGWEIFRDILMHKQLRIEDDLNPDEPAFLDRSALDTLFFWDYYNFPFSDAVIKATHERSYRAIFFLEELPRELYEQSASRHESPEQAHAIHEYLRNQYQDIAAYLNIPMIFIPFAPPEKRVEMVLDAAAHHRHQTCIASSGTYAFSCSQ